MAEQALYRIILDLAHSPIQEAEDWSWFEIVGDDYGIIHFLKVFTSANPRFSLWIPPSIDIDDLTIAREKAQEIIRPSVYFSEDDFCALIGEEGEEAEVTLFPHLRPWDGAKQFEEFLRLSTSSPPSLVVLPSRWRELLLPCITRNLSLPVEIVNEGGIIPRIYIGYKGSVSHEEKDL